MKAQKRIWIVGASSGIGLEVVKLCLNRNYFVIASSRNATKTDELLKLQKKFENQIHLLDIDVSSKTDVKNKVKSACSVYDGLDIWFYNAAVYDSMSIKEWNLEKFENMNDVNYLGVIRIMTYLLPLISDEQNVKWIWNCSISSYFGLPKGGGYSAPKAALVNLAESIQPELENKNIQLQIVNHGFVKTRLTEKNDFQMPQLMESNEAAKKILDGIENSSSFEIRFPFGLQIVLSLLKILPYKTSLALTKKTL